MMMRPWAGRCALAVALIVSAVPGAVRQLRRGFGPPDAFSN